MFFDDEVASQAFAQGLRSTRAGAAVEGCRLPSMEAFRCADLQGFRHPHCLALMDRTTRCFARFVAPEFLERAELCERTFGKDADTAQQCIDYRQDLRKVVDFRMDQHAADIPYSQADRRAARHCGIPDAARTVDEYRTRVGCLAPLLCTQQFEAWRACKDGACSPLVVKDLMHCLGEVTSRFSFRAP